MFSLDKKQLNDLDKWKETLVKYDAGAIGGAFTYAFTSTGLGVIVNVYYFMDTDLEQSIDLTDYESW